jgi:hypothetical protein
MGLIAAVAVPAICFMGWDLWKKAGAKADGSGPPAAIAGEAATGGAPQAGTAASPGAPGGNVEGPNVRDLAEILRFDLTPDWIMRRWPWVSTNLAQLQLQGYRVVLVTGTAETDLAGALTYYFNARQQLQQITFQGTTGDARNLVAFLERQYQFTRRFTNDPALAVYESVHADGKPAGGAQITSAGIIKASEPYNRFQVELWLERP